MFFSLKHVFFFLALPHSFNLNCQLCLINIFITNIRCKFLQKMKLEKKNSKNNNEYRIPTCKNLLPVYKFIALPIHLHPPLLLDLGEGGLLV